jgi:hypothetical protein
MKLIVALFALASLSAYADHHGSYDKSEKKDKEAREGTIKHKQMVEDGEDLDDSTEEAQTPRMDY